MVPTYTVDPATTDFEEAHGARAADLLLQFARNSQNLDLIYSKLCGYLPWSGNSFAQLSWNKLGGQKITYCDKCHYFTYDLELANQPCPQCAMQQQEVAMMMQQHEMLQGQHQEDLQKAEAMGMDPNEIQAPPEPDIGDRPMPGSPIGIMAEAFEGDVKVTVRDPRDVFLPVGCIDITEASRVVIREQVEVAEARARFPQFALFLKEDSVSPTAKQGTTHTDVGTSFESMVDHCDIYHCIEKPTEAYPRGREIFMINDLIVAENENPLYKLGRVPVFHFGFDPVEGEFYCDSFISQAWHRQRELNLLETQMREHISMVLRPKLMTPIGARLSSEDFTADSDQVITYANVQGKPDWINPPPVPSGIWERKADLLQDIRMEAGITESEQGLSVSDPNGRAMAIINSEADQQVGPIMARNNSEWKALHRAILIVYQCYAHPERSAAIGGPDGTAMVYFHALNLLQPGWDVRMEQEEGASRNPAVRLTDAMSLATAGYFMDPATGMLDKKAFARYAKLSSPDRGSDQESTERAAAAQIPFLLQKGQPWQPRTFDVPTIFADELAGWLRGPGRRAPAQLSQQVEQIWMYYAQWAMTGQMQQQPQQGQPGQGASQSASGPAGNDSSAQGGTPNNSGRLGTDLAGEADSAVKSADQQGESLAGAY
jgi:hypothetical protein